MTEFLTRASLDELDALRMQILQWLEAETDYQPAQRSGRVGLVDYISKSARFTVGVLDALQTRPGERLPWLSLLSAPMIARWPKNRRDGGGTDGEWREFIVERALRLQDAAWPEDVHAPPGTPLRAAPRSWATHIEEARPIMFGPYLLPNNVTRATNVEFRAGFRKAAEPWMTWDVGSSVEYVVEAYVFRRAGTPGNKLPAHEPPPDSALRLLVLPGHDPPRRPRGRRRVGFTDTAPSWATTTDLDRGATMPVEVDYVVAGASSRDVSIIAGLALHRAGMLREKESRMFKSNLAGAIEVSVTANETLSRTEAEALAHALLGGKRGHVFRRPVRASALVDYFRKALKHVRNAPTSLKDPDAIAALPSPAMDVGSGHEPRRRRPTNRPRRRRPRRHHPRCRARCHGPPTRRRSPRGRSPVRHRSEP